MKPKQCKMMMRFEPVQQGNIYRLYIYDEVKAYGKFDWNTWTYVESETSANYFRQQLEQIPENAVIELYINSNGGSVKEGVSIYNQLKRHPAQKTGIVDGFCYSVALVILQACDKRIMNLGTSALAHNMLMEVYGNSKDLRQAADDLDNMMVSNRQIFLKRSEGKITEEQLIELMEAEKIMTPDECLEYGFIDEISDCLAEENTGDAEQMERLNPMMILQMQQNMMNMSKNIDTLMQLATSQQSRQDEGHQDEQGNKGQQSICESFFNAIK